MGFLNHLASCSPPLDALFLKTTFVKSRFGLLPVPTNGCQSICLQNLIQLFPLSHDFSEIKTYRIERR